MLRRAPRAAARASPRRPPARRLSSAAAQTYDVVIVGAGVIGASCSLQLARKGFRTLNVDKGPAAGSGSTSYSSGNLRSMYTALTSTMFADEGYHFWQDWQGQLGLSADGDGHGLAAYRPTGGGIMHTDASSAFLEGCYANHDQLGIPYERWDVAELTRRIPIFDPTAYYPPRRIDDPDFGTPSTEHSFYGAGYFPQAGYVSDPMLAAINVMTAAKEAGASYRFNRYPNATQPPLFLGRFSPVFRRFSAVVLCCLAFWRQDGENGRKMAENGRNLGEKRARNSGG